MIGKRVAITGDRVVGVGELRAVLFCVAVVFTTIGYIVGRLI